MTTRYGLGTLGGGLNRFKDGRFTTISPEAGLPNGFISHIEDDGWDFSGSVPTTNFSASPKRA